MERSCPRSKCHLHRGVIDEVDECMPWQTQASPSVAYFSLVSLCFVRLPGGLCISSFPCKPFWRDCLSVVLSSVQHSGVSVPAVTLAVKNRQSPPGLQ